MVPETSQLSPSSGRWPLPSEAHNLSFGGQMLFTVPTGSYKNGTAVSTFQPTLMGGKGRGKFAIQSALGAILPNSSALTLGRTVAWNTTAQYKVGKIFWPEIESNASFYHGGPNDGRTPELPLARNHGQPRQAAQGSQRSAGPGLRRLHADCDLQVPRLQTMRWYSPAGSRSRRSHPAAVADWL